MREHACKDEWRDKEEKKKSSEVEFHYKQWVKKAVHLMGNGQNKTFGV